MLVMRPDCRNVKVARSHSKAARMHNGKAAHSNNRRCGGYCKVLMVVVLISVVVVAVVIVILVVTVVVNSLGSNSSSSSRSRLWSMCSFMQVVEVFAVVLRVAIVSQRQASVLQS